MNGRLDSMQAAVLLAKLTVFADELAARERVARYYDSRLGNAVVTPARVPDSTSAWAIYAILLRDAATRDHVQASLRADGVPTAIYYPRPLHLQPAYRDHHDGAACRCRRIWRSAFWRCRSIPISARPTWRTCAIACWPR